MPHFLLAPFPVWGHTRPLISLALNLITSDPELSITLLCPHDFVPHVQVEIERFAETAAPQLHVTPVGHSIKENHQLSEATALVTSLVERVEHLLYAQLVEFFQRLPAILAAMLALPPHGEGIMRRPTLAITDVLLYPFSDILSAVLEKMDLLPSVLPEYVFSATTAASVIEHSGTNGHFSNLEAKARTLVATGALDVTGKDSVEILTAALLHNQTNKIAHYAGTTPLYDHEFQPQLENVPLRPQAVNTLVAAVSHVKKAAGLVLSTTYEVEPGARESLATSLKVPVLQIGPQFPHHWWSITPGTVTPSELVHPQDQEIISFLDVCEARSGPKSVLYISFGSLFFPAARPDMVRLLVQSLLATTPRTPFLFGLAGCPPEFVPELRGLLKGHEDISMLCHFTPQMAVLRHPATGWFLTHGGCNSMFEAIFCKVPLILWPMATDQILNSAHLSQVLKIGIELIQVRNGPSIGRPTFRGITPTGKPEDLVMEFRQTWEKIRGKEGTAMRERIEGVSKTVKESWEKGESRKSMDSLLALGSE